MGKGKKGIALRVIWLMELLCLASIQLQ